MTTFAIVGMACLIPRTTAQNPLDGLRDTIFGRRGLNVSELLDGRYVKTEFKDAVGNASFLDGMEPEPYGFLPIEVLPKGPEGGYLVYPGAYSGKFQTY